MAHFRKNRRQASICDELHAQWKHIRYFAEKTDFQRLIVLIRSGRLRSRRGGVGKCEETHGVIYADYYIRGTLTGKTTSRRHAGDLDLPTWWNPRTSGR